MKYVIALTFREIVNLQSLKIKNNKQVKKDSLGNFSAELSSPVLRFKT